MEGLFSVICFYVYHSSCGSEPKSTPPKLQEIQCLVHRLILSCSWTWRSYFYIQTDPSTAPESKGKMVEMWESAMSGVWVGSTVSYGLTHINTPGAFWDVPGYTAAADMAAFFGRASSNMDPVMVTEISNFKRPLRASIEDLSTLQSGL